jgi:hypothetical protein
LSGGEVRHSGKMAISAKERAGRNLPLSTKGGENENVDIGYHESLSSQAKSGRIYVLLQKIMAAGIIAKEEQPDHYGNSEKGPVLQNLREIDRALVNLPRCGI